MGGGSIGWVTLLNYIAVGWAYKVTVEVALLPVTYKVIAWVRRGRASRRGIPVMVARRNIDRRSRSEEEGSGQEALTAQIKATPTCPGIATAIIGQTSGKLDQLRRICCRLTLGRQNAERESIETLPSFVPKSFLTIRGNDRGGPRTPPSPP